MTRTTYLHPYTFDASGLADEEGAALEQMQSLNLGTQDFLSKALEVPEPACVLNIGGRGTDETRQFKHIHQMCSLHALHFELSNQIKAAHIVDWYLWAAARLNPIGIYSAARSLLELHAMLSLIEHMLEEARHGTKLEWKVRGRRFFQVIVRARYGTTDPDLRAALGSEGVPEECMKLYTIKEARHRLNSELEWVDPYYTRLCDFVHHNLLSQRTAGEFAGVSSVAQHSARGKFVLSSPSPVTHYAFPLEVPGSTALANTATRARDNLLGIVGAINRFARTPYADEELTAWTGSRLGVRRLDTPAAPTAVFRNARPNDPCPCGSGLKFKKCHSGANP